MDEQGIKDKLQTRLPYHHILVERDQELFLISVGLTVMFEKKPHHLRYVHSVDAERLELLRDPEGYFDYLARLIAKETFAPLLKVL